MGAHFYFDHIITGDNKNIIDGLNKKKYNILCADLKGNKLSTLNIKNKWCCIFCIFCICWILIDFVYVVYFVLFVFVPKPWPSGMRVSD